MTHLWAYSHDQHSRDEILKLHPAFQQVVTVSVEDLNLDCPSSLPFEEFQAYLHKMKLKLLEKAQERQKFNFLLSESRALRCGGNRNKIVEIGANPLSESEIERDREGETEKENEDTGGMAIDFNWRLPRAVKISLPRDIAMAAR